MGRLSGIDRGIAKALLIDSVAGWMMPECGESAFIQKTAQLLKTER